MPTVTQTLKVAAIKMNTGSNETSANVKKANKKFFRDVKKPLSQESKADTKQRPEWNAASHGSLPEKSRHRRPRLKMNPSQATTS